MIAEHEEPNDGAEIPGDLEERLAQALATSGASAVMLSGGETPLPAYRALASRPPRHDAALHVLFSDERYVPSDSDASNYHRARPLLEALALPPQQLLRVCTELPLEQAAQGYERALDRLLDVAKTDRGFDDDAARRKMLRIFEALGNDNDLVRRYRRELASAINR